MKSPLHFPSKQQGAALLVMTIILLATFLGLTLRALNSDNYKLRQQSTTQSLLHSAKQRLLAYAVLADIDSGQTGLGPGHMVCPDSTNDGLPETNCNSIDIARIPQLLPLVPGPGANTFIEFESTENALWYGVSSAFRQSSASVVNTTTGGMFSVDGEADIVAIIIAPGSPFQNQTRHNNSAANYLEGNNISGPNFIRGTQQSTINNDQIVSISQSELMTLVTARIAGVIKSELDSIYAANGNNYPTPTEFESQTLGVWPAWFASNNWQLPAVTTYTQLANDQVEVTFANCNIIYSLDQGFATVGRRPVALGQAPGC